MAEPDYRTEANKPVRDDGLNTTNGSVESKTATSTLRNTPSASGSPTGRDATSGPPESAKPVVVKEKPLVKDAPVQPSSPVKTPAATSPASDASKKAASTLPRTAIPPPVASPPIAPEPDPISPLNSGVSPLDEMPALPDPKTEEATRRDSLKPVFPSTDSPRSKRNVLEGKIVSADSLNPEENVEVVISDQTGRFLDRTTRTNAFGQFAISLPEGDWTIRVTMPSGRILSVEQGRISASAGKIIDMYGRDLKNLVIKR